MLAVNYSTIRENFKAYCDKVTDNGETVIVTRKDEKNVVLISLEEYTLMQRISNNADYISKLARSAAEVAAGNVVSKTFDELEAMEDE